jgi:hypothetical protein
MLKLLRLLDRIVCDANTVPGERVLTVRRRIERDLEVRLAAGAVVMNRTPLFVSISMSIQPVVSAAIGAPSRVKAMVRGNVVAPSPWISARLTSGISRSSVIDGASIT